jgi:mycoredoxin
MEKLELFGSASCPYTGDLREELLWQNRAFTEYDVEADPEALRRMMVLTGGNRTVPVLAQNGEVVQIGWQGRGCIVSAPTTHHES